MKTRGTENHQDYTNGFLLKLKKGNKPETFVFFRKTFDTFLYFFTEYHLISYTWSTC